MNTNYSSIPNTTATVDTSQWHKIRVTGLTGITRILGWLMDNKKQLAGGYMLDGNCIYLQDKKDATFFNLTIQKDD